MHIIRPELFESVTNSSEDQCFERAADQGLKHKLKKFQQDIYWDIIYQESAVHDYINAFGIGFDLVSYSFAPECLEHSTASLNRLNEFHIQMIERRTWNDPFQLAAQSLAVNYNNGWFYCYQFVFDFNATFHAKFDRYKPCNRTYQKDIDTGKQYLVLEDCSGRRREIFLSFLFNLISESINIRDSFTNMNQSFTDHNSVEYFKNLGNLLRVLYNFESFNIIREDQLVKDQSLLMLIYRAFEYSQLPESEKHSSVPPKEERQRMYDEERERKKREYYESKRRRNRHRFQTDVPGDRGDPEAEGEEAPPEDLGPINCNTGLPFEKKKVDEEEVDIFDIFDDFNEFTALQSLARHNLTTGCSRNGTLYKWTRYDYASAPFALVVGALNALGTGSQSTYCSRYTLSARSKFLEAREGFKISKLEGYTSVHDGILYFENIAFTCYNSFSEEISINHFKGIYRAPWKFAINLLYNVGAMYNDIIKYLFYDQFTVENGDWAFFVWFHIGDFVMRLFFNASDAGDNVQISTT